MKRRSTCKSISINYNFKTTCSESYLMLFKVTVYKQQKNYYNELKLCCINAGKTIKVLCQLEIYLSPSLFERIVAQNCFFEEDYLSENKNVLSLQ